MFFPEVRTKQRTIQETIRREEEAFNRTLDNGIELFEREVARMMNARSPSGRPLPAGCIGHPAGMLLPGGARSHEARVFALEKLNAIIQSAIKRFFLHDGLFPESSSASSAAIRKNIAHRLRDDIDV